MGKQSGVYTYRVEVEEGDVTHEIAKDELARLLSGAVERGMQINGIREPVYGLDENGNRIVIAYESLAWAYARPSNAPRRARVHDDDLGLVLTESGVAISL